MMARRKSFAPPFARTRQIWKNPPRPRPVEEAPAPVPEPEPVEVPAPVPVAVVHKPVPAPAPAPVPEPEVESEPLWNKRMNKDDLLAVAADLGIKGLSSETPKKDILSALENWEK